MIFDIQDFSNVFRFQTIFKTTLNFCYIFRMIRYVSKLLFFFVRDNVYKCDLNGKVNLFIAC